MVVDLSTALLTGLENPKAAGASALTSPYTFFLNDLLQAVVRVVRPVCYSGARLRGALSCFDTLLDLDHIARSRSCPARHDDNKVW